MYLFNPILFILILISWESPETDRVLKMFTNSMIGHLVLVQHMT